MNWTDPEVTILIRRIPNGLPRSGTLAAYVKQGSEIGFDLLSERRITNIGIAQREVQRTLPHCVKTIHWDIEADER